MKTINLRVPSNSLVVMVGVSGSGKSVLAEKLFGADKIVSSDACRRMLGGNLHTDELQKFSEGAFVMFHNWVRARLRHGLLTVADSTALRPEYREDFAKIAQEEHVRVSYLFVDTPYEECLRRNASRPENDRVPEGVIKRQFSTLNRSRRYLRTAENVQAIRPDDEVTLTITESVLGIDAKAIDVVGDVHGCLEELVELITKLGYSPSFRLTAVGPSTPVPPGLDPEKHDDGPPITVDSLFYTHPEGRKLVFVGDLIDRGPEPYKALDFVRRHVQAGLAELVLSNHERKLRNWLSGRNVTIKPAFQKTLDSIPTDVDKRALKAFMYSLRPYRSWMSPKGEAWVVVHAAFDPKFDGKVDKGIEEYCVYGPNEGVDPVTHFPKRIAWWDSYRPGPKVVYGHLITDDGKPRVANGTYGIDTGCVHGGSLTALRLPEEEFVQVKAKQTYFGSEESPEAKAASVAAAGTANIDILTARRVTVRGLDGKNQEVHLRDRGLMDAIDAVSTRTIQPDKLVWLAPTMSPGPVSEDPSLMEHPTPAAKWLFDGAPAGTKLVAQVKHMGSRGTWLCERGTDKAWGIHCWTKNGYEMFDEPRRSRVYEAMQLPLSFLSGLLGGADTILLDSEVMPFNQHGDAWLERTFMQTAAVGKVSRFAMARAANQAGHQVLRDRLLVRMRNIELYGEAAARFCWPVGSEDDIRIGIFDVLYPFQERTHSDLMGLLRSMGDQSLMFRPTDCMVIENTPESLEALSAWWVDLTTQKGVEGVVLKYDDRAVWSNTKFPQQQIKVRGADYLRLAYGPQYLDPEILPKLRAERRLDMKQRMAYQQTLLGREALVRNFVEKRPFEQWHEVILGILAAERATVDPRL